MRLPAKADWHLVQCSIDLDEMRGKPEKSFNRITEALTEKFPQPLGMLNDMLTQIEELMGKHYSQYLADMQAVFHTV